MRPVPGTGAVQRLKQHNQGATLRVNADDLLIGFRMPRPRGDPDRVIRLHVGLNGYAERAYYEIGRSHGRFSHRDVRLDEDRLRTIQAALRLAHAERPREMFHPDPNRVYRTLEFRDGDQIHGLIAEDDDLSPPPDWPALDAAWMLLEAQFRTDADA